MLDTKYRQALVRGSELMIEHGLGDWIVGLHNKRRVLADCDNKYKTIRYSTYFLQAADKDQFERVTLHEIAHALVGSGHGHDKIFKAKVREITPGRAYDTTSVPDPMGVFKYKLVCPSCGLEGGRNRINVYPPICTRCSGDTTVEFIVTLNKINLKVW